MINIFQLTTCNYSEGLIPLISVFLDCRCAFSGGGDREQLRGSCVLGLSLAHMFICIRPLKLPFDLEISSHTVACVFAYVHFLEIVSAAHLKTGEVTGNCWSGIWD